MTEYSKNQGDDFLRLKVPESQKTKEWYKYQADRIIPTAQYARIQGTEEMRKMYRLLNNDLSGFEEEIRPYCSDLAEFGAVEEELVPYNPLPNKLEQLKGQMLYRGNTYRVMLLNAKAVRAKDQAFQDRIKATVSEEMQLALEAHKAKLEGMTDEQIDKHIEELRSLHPLSKLDRRKFLTQAEIIFSKLVQYTEATQDVRTKKMETLEDAALVSSLFVRNVWRNGRPEMDVINPINVGFAKAPDEPYVQKGDYWWYRDHITLADCFDEYINELSPEDTHKLIQFGQRGNSMSSDHVTKPVFDYTRFYSILEALGEGDAAFANEGLHQGNQLTNMNFNYLVPRIYLEFKAYEETIFISHINELGARVTKQLSSKAKNIIPDYASKLRYTNRYGQKSYKYVWTEADVELEAEILWIPRRYELTRLGQDIDLHFRKVPHQPDYENPFSDFELSCKGTILYNRNAKSLSPVQRALPYIFQYMSARRIQNRELAKFVGQEKVVDVDQVPSDLANDHGGNSDDPVLNQEVIARKTGTRFISSSQSSGGLPVPTTRGKGVEYQLIDTTPILMNLEAFCSEIDRKIGLRMGMPDATLGNVQSRTTARDNEMSRRSGDIQTSSLYYTIDRVWSYAMDEHLKNLQQLIRGHFSDDSSLEDFKLEAILPDGSKEFVAITKNDLQELQHLGLHHYDTGKEKIYFDYMLNSVFSFAQNAGEGVETVSSVLKALTSTTSVEEMHEVIRQTTEELRERTQKEIEAQGKQQEAMQKMQMDLMREQFQMQLEGKLVEIDRKAAGDLDRAMITSQTLANQYDIDRNKVNDMLQKERERMLFEEQENAKDRAHDKELERIKASKKPNN